MGFDRAGFDREVGLRLQRARKSQGVTQDELAKRIGLPRPSYANIESGRQRIPIDVVWRAAVVLGLSIAALVPDPVRKRMAPPVLVSIGGAALPTFSTQQWTLEGGTPPDFSRITTAAPLVALMDKRKEESDV
jgi:transcriptional regulator with XRE-family HTH domain